VVARPCEVSLGASILWYCVHVPFVARGAQGKKCTPSVGLEVPVRSHWSESGI
jgi:hypothetical protein